MCSQKKDFLRDPGIEPGSVPWQGTILPLNQPRFRFHGSQLFVGCCYLSAALNNGNLSEMSILCVYLTCYEKGNQF